MDFFDWLFGLFSEDDVEEEEDLYRAGGSRGQY